MPEHTEPVSLHPDPDAPPPAGEEDVEALRSALAAAEGEAARNRDQVLRAAAELDNIRKRAARDVEQAHRYGLE